MDLFGSKTTTETPGTTSWPTDLFGQTVAGLQTMGNPYAMSSPQWAALANLLGATNAPRPNPVTDNPGWQAYLTNAKALQGYQSGFSPQQVSGFAPTTYGAVGMPSASQYGAVGMPSASQYGAVAGPAPSQYDPASFPGMGFSGATVNYTPTATSYGAVDVPGQAPVTTKQIDPAAAYAAAAQQLTKFATPQVQAAMQASGMGRSGAVGEGISNAAASLALPINQQVLASQAQANQLDAQIKAKQEESTMLATVQSRLQAQQLTATSESQRQQLSAQIAEVQAQLQNNAAIIQFQGQVQAALQAQNLTAASQSQANALGMQSGLQAQGLSAASQAQINQLLAQAGLQGQNLSAASQAQINQLLGQAGLQGQNLSAASQQQANQSGFQAQQLNQAAGLNQYGMNLTAGTAQQAQLAQLAQMFPQIFNQQYLSGITGAQAGMQAANFPQSLDIANQKQQQDFLTRLLGAQRTGTTTSTTQDPGILGLAGMPLQVANLLGGSAGGLGVLGAIGSGIGAGYQGLFGSTPGGGTPFTNLFTPNYDYSPTTYLDPFSTMGGFTPSFDPTSVSDWGWF